MPEFLANLDLSELIPFQQLVFWVMTLCTIGGALGVVSSRKLFHSALYLILSLFGVAGYYVLLSAGFLAVVQLLIYVGAIAILVLFAIMFSREPMAPSHTEANQQWEISMPFAAILFIILAAIPLVVEWPVSNAEPLPDMVEALGVAFLGSYLIPFEIIGVLLSVALIGAVMLAREKTEAEEAQE